MNDLDVLSKKLSSLREYLGHLEQAHDITCMIKLMMRLSLESFEDV